MLSKLIHIILSPLLWFVSFVPLKILYIKSLILSNFFIYRKDIIKSNIDNAFNNLNIDHKKQIIKGFRMYFLNLIAEIVKMISVNKKFYSNRITVNNIEILDTFYSGRLDTLFGKYGSYFISNFVKYIYRRIV